MSELSEMSKEDLVEEVSRLRDELDQMRTKRAFTREDRLKLSILDRAPFTIWACDRNFEIQLWSGTCQTNYGHMAEDAIGKNYLELFVDEHEQDQSEEDCIAIIAKDKVFSNFLASDKALDGSTRLMLTNCFRIYDDDNKQWLQAEIGLEISDLEDSEREHRNIREKGAYDRGVKQKYIDLLKHDLTRQAGDILMQNQLTLHDKQRDLESGRRRLEPELGKDEAKNIFQEDLKKIEIERRRITDRHQEIVQEITHAEKEEELTKIQQKINRFLKAEI